MCKDNQLLLRRAFRKHIQALNILLKAKMFKTKITKKENINNYKPIYVFRCNLAAFRTSPFFPRTSSHPVRFIFYTSRKCCAFLPTFPPTTLILTCFQNSLLLILPWFCLNKCDHYFVSYHCSL